MTAFEFVFSLFGLVLGLSVAEILIGFSRVARAAGRIHLGLLTPMLGALLLLDLLTFWLHAWDLRGAIPIRFASLVFGTGIAGIYFVAASLVFPEAFDEWPDLDAYFFANKKWVMAGTISANWLMSLAVGLLLGNPFTSVASLAVPVGFTVLALALALTRSKPLSLAIGAILLAAYLSHLF